MTCLIRTWATGKWSYLLQAVSRITWKKYPTDLRSGFSVKECPNPEQIPRSGMNSNVSWRLRGLRSSKVWFRMLYSIRSRPCFFRHTAGRWDKDEKKQRRDLDKERREILFWIQTPCNYGLWLRSDTKWNKMSAWITGWYSFSRNPGIRNWFIHHSLIIYLVQIQRRKGGLPSMEQNTPPTLKQKLHSLAAFLPIFEQQDFIFGTWVKQKKGSPAFLRCHISVSPANADVFFQSAYDLGWVLRDFNWPQWKFTSEATGLRDDPTKLAIATPDQLFQLITTVIRQDRFWDGELENAFESGLLTEICRRAAQLDAEMDDEEAWQVTNPLLFSKTRYGWMCWWYESRAHPRITINAGRPQGNWKMPLPLCKWTCIFLNLISSNPSTAFMPHYSPHISIIV